jgi:hypothetical protein
VDNVILELRNATRSSFKKMVRFHDDDLLARDNGWLKEFAHSYKEQIGLPFACFIHPNTITEEKIEFLKIAGCHDVEIGIQAISEATRKNILRRNVSQERLISSLSILKEYGINVITDNILGIPGQDINEAIELLKFYNNNRVMKIYCFGFRYYPKTQIIDYSREAVRLSDIDIIKIEEGVNAKAFIQGGDHWDSKIKQIQTFLTFLLYFPKGLNNFILRFRLFRFFPHLPYFIGVIFSNWLRIPFKYNWALHITISRYRYFICKGRRRQILNN